VNANKELIFKASMEIDAADVGKVADILLVIGVEPKAVTFLLNTVEHNCSSVSTNAD